MPTRFIRNGGAMIGALMTLACSGAFAAPPTPRPERSLLGIKLSASFNDVLHKFGQPSEIQAGDPAVTALAQAGMPQGAGGGMPGSNGATLPGFQGMPGMRQGGMPSGMNPGMMSGMPQSMRSSMSGMNPGMRQSGMPSGMPQSMMSSMSGMNPGMRQSGMPSGMPQSMMSGMPQSMMSSMPGMAGRGVPGLPGFSGAASSLPGMGGMGGTNSTQQYGGSGESTWWYHYPKQGLHYSFLFNNKGQVIQIQAYGYKPSGKLAAPRTVEGITLGSSLGQVIQRYGWSSDGEHDGDYVVLRYGAPDQVAFQARHNQVIGIVLGLVNN